jgi:hypothetical protein
MPQINRLGARGSQRVVDGAAWLPCRQCGTRFQPVRPHQHYCRPSCRWEAFKARQTRVVDAPDAERISRGLFE